MANFNTHLVGGFVVSAICAVVCFKAGLLSNQQLVICTAIGTVGGLLPDIDSDNSTPIKLGFNLAALTVAFILVMHWRSELPLLYLFALWATGFVSIRYLAFNLFSKMTRHRGVIHSIPYMACLALGLVIINHNVLETDVLNSWLYGLFLFIGSITHLVLDEMYAVNLLNVRLKRSFGTALKIYTNKDKWYFAMVYLSLAGLIYISPPIDAFLHKVTDPITWLILSKSII